MSTHFFSLYILHDSYNMFVHIGFFIFVIIHDENRCINFFFHMFFFVNQQSKLNKGKPIKNFHDLRFSFYSSMFERKKTYMLTPTLVELLLYTLHMISFPFICQFCFLSNTAFCPFPSYSNSKENIILTTNHWHCIDHVNYNANNKGPLVLRTVLIF